MMEALYKAEDVADQLGIGRSTVYELIRSGELKAVSIGKLRRVPASSIEKFIEEHKLGG